MKIPQEMFNSFMNKLSVLDITDYGKGFYIAQFLLLMDYYDEPKENEK